MSTTTPTIINYNTTRLLKVFRQSAIRTIFSNIELLTILRYYAENRHNRQNINPQYTIDEFISFIENRVNSITDTNSRSYNSANDMDNFRRLIELTITQTQSNQNLLFATKMTSDPNDPNSGLALDENNNPITTPDPASQINDMLNRLNTLGETTPAPDSSVDDVRNFLNERRQNTELVIADNDALDMGISPQGDDNFPAVRDFEINHMKLNNLIVLDIQATTSGETLNNKTINLNTPLILYKECDVILEFVSLHSLVTNGDKSIQNYHCFMLEIKEFNDYITTFSNNAALSNKIIIPNETFGFKDSDDSNIIHDGGSISSGSGTSYVLDNGSLDNDYYNNYYLTIIDGPGIGESKIITDYDGGSKTVTVTSFSENLTVDSKFIIEQYSETSKKVSFVLKLKSNFVCNIGPIQQGTQKRFNTFTVSLTGLLKGASSAENLKLVDTNSRVQIGMYFKSR